MSESEGKTEPIRDPYLNEVTHLNKLILSLNEKIDTKKAEYQELDVQISMINQKMDTLQYRIEEFENKTDKASIEEKAKLKKESKVLFSELGSKSAERQKVDDEWYNLENELKKAEDKLKNLKEKHQIEEDRVKLFRNASAISRKLWKDTSICAEEHALSAETWGRYHLWLGIIATGISAIVGGGIFTDNDSLVLLAGILSLILVTVSALATFLNAEQRSTAHYQAGTAYRVLSHKAELLVDIDLKLQGKKTEEIAAALNELIAERDDLTKKSPRVSNRYHKTAVKNWEKARLELEEAGKESNGTL